MAEVVTNAAPAATETPIQNTEAVKDTSNSDASLQADGKPTDPAAAAAKKEEPKSSKKKYKIKVDKNEEDVEFDPHNDEEVTKYLQKARASEKRFAEANEVRKAAMEFIDQLRKNPRKVLADPSIGVDVKKFAEDIINEQIADLEKSPEQREKEKLQKELEELKQQAKDREENLKKTDISAALDVGGIPKTPRTVARMAEMMMIALNNGIDLSAKDIAPLVKNNTMGEFKEIITALSDDQLEDFLGKEVLGRLRKKNVAKAKIADTINSLKSTGVTTKSTEIEKTPKKMTIRDFLKV